MCRVRVCIHDLVCGYNRGEGFVGDSRWGLVFFGVGEDTVRVDSYSKVFEVTLEESLGGFCLISEWGGVASWCSRAGCCCVE